MSLQWEPSNAMEVATYRILRTLTDTLDLEPVATVDGTTYLDSLDTPVSTTLQTDVARGDGGCYQVEALRSDGSVVGTSNRSCDTFGKVELWIPDIWAQSGSTVLVPINIRNASGLRIIANEIRFAYDTNVLSPTRILASSVIQEAYQVASDVQTSDIVRIAAFSEEQPVLYGQGTLFWVEFQVIGDQGSESVLEIRKVTGDVTGSDPGGSIIYASDDLNNPIPLSLVSGRLRVSDTHNMGDVDGNGSMQVDDGTSALHIATGQHQATWQQSGAGDVNGDGRVGAADASMLFYHIMHGTWPQPGQLITQTTRLAGLAATAPGPILSERPGNTSSGVTATQTIVSIEDVRATPGTTVTVPLRATNLMDIAGGEFTVVYDPTIIQGITLNSSVSRVSHDDGNGRLTIALASGQAATGDGVLATLTLQIAPTAENGTSTTLTLAEAHLNDLAGRDLATSALQQSVKRHSGVVRIGPASTYLPLVQR
jgi:hypothetical protein